MSCIKDSGIWMLDAAHSDLEVLALTDLLNARTDVRGRISHLTVMPYALDYYEALAREDAALGGDGVGNEPFTEREIALIDAGIERMRAYLREANVTEERMAGFERRLDYLAAAARRCGRFDWSVIARHVVWDIAVAASFAPDRAYELLQMLVGGVRGLLGG